MGAARIRDRRLSWLGLELHKGVFAAYREGWAERGNPAGGERLAYLSSYVVAETDEEARRLAEQHFPEQVSLFDYEEGRSYWFGDTDVKRVYKGLLEMFAKIKQPENFDPPLIVVHGSPETVTEKIRMLQQELGINTIFGEFNFGLMPWETAQRSLKLFAEEVMPNFERTEAGELAAMKA